MRRAAVILAGVAALAVLVGGCRFRAVAPPALAESVRIVVVGSDARLVRIQAHLQSEVARALQDRLGWTISPRGTARLELSVRQEDIDATSSTTRDLPNRWSIRIDGTALFVCARGNATTTYVGTGYSSGLADEPEAIRAAAVSAAAHLAGWLERAAEEFTGPSAPAGGG